MQIIQISFIKNGVWLASHYTTNKHDMSLTPDKSLISLFGTHSLPTPYPDYTCPHEVAEMIQNKNPQAIVEVV
jgi:hypothetical protein